MATSLGVLIVVLDFTGVSREEFDAWYDTEHIPERQRVWISVGAALAVRGWQPAVVCDLRS